MIYVVEYAQGYPFQNLFKECQHVKFEKILGISTRRGNMVYISDLMEEATEIMLENQEKSENTRIFVGSHLW